MKLAELIASHRSRFAPLFKPALTADNSIDMALGADESFEMPGEDELDAAIFARIEAAGAIAGVGGYLEKRSVYRDTELFQGDAERCIHIGVDVFMPAGTSIYAPLDGVLHSFADRQVAGDYGPVIIVGHALDGYEFFTLYGHLSRESLHGLEAGMGIARHAKIAEIGARPINGNWTPHLHFQLIRDLQGKRGDYPGVVRPDELDFYRVNCPDPGALLVA